MGGISIWQLLIVLGIVVLIFGTKKLRSLGGDLGSAIKSFKQAVNEEEKEAKDDTESSQEPLEKRESSTQKRTESSSHEHNQS